MSFGAMAHIAPGTTISHYRILETLGQGGQATAYKAEDTRLSRPVVIKTLRPELAASEAARRRFEREACLCSALDNPNIQSVYDIGEDDGLYYIVMQFVEGTTVKQIMNGRPLEPMSALSIAIQVADALAVAHAHGIVHRDIKPANVIVNAQGQAKVLDFGLAKMLALSAEVKDKTPSDDSVTEVGVPYGSMGYSSPEQAAGDRVDHRTDIFSLGVLLYEMLAGQAPFRGKHAVELLNAVINQDAPPLRQVNPRVPVLLVPIVDRAMAKHARDRHPTMAAIRDELKTAQRRLSRIAAPGPGETLRPPAQAYQARASWLLASTLGRVLRRVRPGSSDHDRARSGPTGAAGTIARPPNWGAEARRTLAVLPFRNLADDPELAYFEFALADAIITELAHVKSLIVRPSAYVAPYAGQDFDPRQVGRELLTQSVLTGTFLRTTDRLRVNVQLLDTETGHLLFGDRADFETRDLLSVQDAIAERILAGLRLRLTEEEEEEIHRPVTRSAEAYTFYLRARDVLFRYILKTHDEADLERAIGLCHEAIGRDARFARAHATLGRCYILHAQGWGGADYYVLAERSLRQALDIDPGILNARIHMVYVDLHHGDKDRARATVQELLSEHPDEPMVLFVSAMVFRLDGLYDEALAAYDRLLDLAPRDSVVIAYNKARIYTHAGRYEEALAELDKARAAEGEHPLVKTFLAVVHFTKGEVAEAQALLEDVVRSSPHFDGVLPLLAWCYSARGEHDQARALITERVIEVAEADHDIALWLASFYALEGMNDEAMVWVKTAVRLGNENFPLLERTPRLDGLREDPRFLELMDELRRRREARLSPAPSQGAAS